MDEEGQGGWEPTEHPAPSTTTGAQPPAEPPHAQEPATPAALPPQEEKTWALFAHLSALSGLILPFGNILGPLVVWLIKKDESRFVDDQGKEALNFQITISIVILLAGAVAFVGTVLAFLLIGIPFMLLGMLAIGLFWLIGMVFAIVGGVKAHEGAWYRYPMTWRFIQ